MKKNQLTKRKVVVLENGLISTYTMREALMDELLRNNFEVFILTHTNQFQQEVESRGLKVIHVGSANTNILKIGSYIFNIYKAIRQIKPDICLTFSVRPAIWGNLVARLQNIPVITNISGLGPLVSSQSIAYKFVRKVYPFALSKTSKVFFQNKEDQKVFIRHKFVSASKTDWIPGSGVDYHKFAPVSTENNNSSFVFLFIGRLIKDKGIFEFLEAAKRIKAGNPNTLFRVIGPLWHQNLKSNLVSEHEITKWAEQGIIEYLGEQRDVRPYIADADCIVLPSYREGISNVLLESASMEKPVIATDVPGCREVVDNLVTGLLCRSQDPDDLCEKMEIMLNTDAEERIRMGRNAREKVIMEFDKKIVTDKYLNEIHRWIKSPQTAIFSLPKHIPTAKSDFRYDKKINLAG